MRTMRAIILLALLLQMHTVRANDLQASLEELRAATQMLRSCFSSLDIFENSCFRSVSESEFLRCPLYRDLSAQSRSIARQFFIALRAGEVRFLLTHRDEMNAVTPVLIPILYYIAQGCLYAIVAGEVVYLTWLGLEYADAQWQLVEAQNRSADLDQQRSKAGVPIELDNLGPQQDYRLMIWDYTLMIANLFGANVQLTNGYYPQPHRTRQDFSSTVVPVYDSEFLRWYFGMIISGGGMVPENILQQY